MSAVEYKQYSIILCPSVWVFW